VHEHPPTELTGYICPRCGGAISRRTDGDGAAEYRCRIGHTFTPEQLWIQTCAMRNRAVEAAVRASAEKVDLARALAGEARNLGNRALAARLEDEAEAEERQVGQLLAMLEALEDEDPETPPDR
jgi:two-component system chemotaxis response regulator CheB